MAAPPSTALRRATPADAGEIRAITRAAYARWVPVIGREPLPMQADYHEALGRHRFDLLQRGAHILALIETAPREDYLWIENIAVRPEEQGAGLGRRLLDHAEALARDAGLGETRLLTNQAFATNVALYERCGYRVTARAEFMNGVTVFMSKRIG